MSRQALSAFALALVIGLLNVPFLALADPPSEPALRVAYLSTAARTLPIGVDTFRDGRLDEFGLSEDAVQLTAEGRVRPTGLKPQFFPANGCCGMTVRLTAEAEDVRIEVRYGASQAAAGDATATVTERVAWPKDVAPVALAAWRHEMLAATEVAVDRFLRVYVANRTVAAAR
jgi:hypothetical protein